MDVLSGIAYKGLLGTLEPYEDVEIAPISTRILGNNRQETLRDLIEKKLARAQQSIQEKLTEQLFQPSSLRERFRGGVLSMGLPNREPLEIL